MKNIYLKWEIHLLAGLLRNFLGEFGEKCFAVFDQSKCAIYLTWYWLLLFFREFLSLLLWYDFKILSRKGGTFSCLALSVNVLQKYIYIFNWKLSILSFIFLIWMEQFFNFWIINLQKSKNTQTSEESFYFYFSKTCW